MAVKNEPFLIRNIKDPEVFFALKRLCSFIVSDTWRTSSSEAEYEFAVTKTKQYEADVKKLAELDSDIAWGQTKHLTKEGHWISNSSGDFNPWYKGSLSLDKLLDSVELFVELTESTTPQYLPEIEFLHYYNYLRSKLPSTLPSPAVIRFENLHTKIQQHCNQRYGNGQYADAILAAYKVLFNEIKDVANIHNLDGKQLAEKAFSLSNPIIKLNDLNTQSDKDEQLGFMLLLSGAAVGIRNPKAHDLVEQEDKHKTLRYLAFASLLLERLDGRKAPIQKSV